MTLTISITINLVLLVLLYIKQSQVKQLAIKHNNSLEQFKKVVNALEESSKNAQKKTNKPLARSLQQIDPEAERKKRWLEERYKEMRQRGHQISWKKFAEGFQYHKASSILEESDKLTKGERNG